VSEENTQNLNDSRSFEERVFARFDAIDNRFAATEARFDAIDRGFEGVDARFDAIDRRFEGVDARFDKLDSSIQDLDGRVERLEVRSYDTKPIWEQALKEILETKAEVAETKLEVIDTRRELFKRLDRLGAATLENRADIREAEDRIEKLESKLSQ